MRIERNKTYVAGNGDLYLIYSTRPLGGFYGKVVGGSLLSKIGRITAFKSDGTSAHHVPGCTLQFESIAITLGGAVPMKTIPFSTITEGKRYLMRNGGIAGPASKTGETFLYPWVVPSSSASALSPFNKEYRTNGRWDSSAESPYDLVAEIVESVKATERSEDKRAALIKAALDGEAAFRQLVVEYPGQVEAKLDRSKFDEQQNTSLPEWEPIEGLASVIEYRIKAATFEEFDLDGSDHDVSVTDGMLKVGCTRVDARAAYKALTEIYENAASYAHVGASSAAKLLSCTVDGLLYDDEELSFSDGRQLFFALRDYFSKFDKKDAA